MEILGYKNSFIVGHLYHFKNEGNSYNISKSWILEITKYYLPGLYADIIATYLYAVFKGGNCSLLNLSCYDNTNNIVIFLQFHGQMWLEFKTVHYIVVSLFGHYCRRFCPEFYWRTLIPCTKFNVLSNYGVNVHRNLHCTLHVKFKNFTKH